MKKVQKKYYFPEKTANLVKRASFYSGISQSRIVEACIVVGLANMALEKQGKP